MAGFPRPTHDTLGGKMSRFLAPGSGWCLRCGRAWARTENHSTEYRDGSACFPLCERCWAALTPAERLPYYGTLWDEWMRQGGTPDERWGQIMVAVMAGK